MKIKRVIIVVLFILILVGIAVVAIRRKKAILAKAKPVGNMPIPVSVEEVKRGDFSAFKRYVGIVKPLNTANISSRITAEITKIYYTEGNNVKKGDLLMKLDDRNLKQAIAVLKAKAEGVKTQIVSNNVNIKSMTSSVAYWKKQLDRDKKLFDKNIVSAKQLELTTEKLNEIQGEFDVTLQKNKTLEATLKVIKGDIKLAETNLSYADITAPFDGVICDIPVDPGDLAAPGKKLIEVENQNKLKVAVEIPQVDIKYIKLGENLKIQCRAFEADAKISKIFPALGVNRMMKIEAILPDKNKQGFVSGQYVQVLLTTEILKNVLTVPSASLNIDNKKSNEKYLFLLKNGRLKKTDVKILGNNEQAVAVSGDLQVGDRVVVSAYLGWAELADTLKAEEVK